MNGKRRTSLETIAGTTIVTRRELQKAIEIQLRVTYRAAQSAVWSLQSQGWPLDRGGINAPFSEVSSAEAAIAWIRDDIARRHIESRRANASMPRSRVTLTSQRDTQTDTSERYYAQMSRAEKP